MFEPKSIVIPFAHIVGRKVCALDEEDKIYRAGARSGRPLVRTALSLPQCLRHGTII